MAKGTRLSEEVKMDIAKRAQEGEDPIGLAGKFGIAVSTVLDYKGRYPKKRTVNRNVVVPRRNTRVSDAETKGLREEVQRLRGLLLDEILRNRDS